MRKELTLEAIVAESVLQQVFTDLTLLMAKRGEADDSFNYPQVIDSFRSALERVRGLLETDFSNYVNTIYNEKYLNSVGIIIELAKYFNKNGSPDQKKGLAIWLKEPENNLVPNGGKIVEYLFLSLQNEINNTPILKGFILEINSKQMGNANGKVDSNRFQIQDLLYDKVSEMFGLPSPPKSSSQTDLVDFISTKPELARPIEGYLRAIWSKYYTLRLSLLANNILSDNGIPLPNVYTALNTANEIYLEKNATSKEWTVLELLSVVNTDYLKSRLLRRTSYLPRSTKSITYSLTAVEFLADNSNCVVLGPPGSGKSTFAYFVTLCMAGEILGEKEANLSVLNSNPGKDIPRAWPYGVLFPICIELRSFVRSSSFPPKGVEGNAQHLIDFIKSLSNQGDLNVEELITEATLGKILVLDGFDEIPKANENRERLKEIILDLNNKFNNVRVLITSRPFSYRESAWNLNEYGYRDTALEDLDKNQIIEFVYRWYSQLGKIGLIDIEVVRERADLLLERIRQSDYLNELASNPLLLTMIAIANERAGGLLPINRSKLFEDIVELLVDNWNSQRGINSKMLSEDLGTDPESVLRTLEKLAFNIHQEEQRSDKPVAITRERIQKEFLGLTKKPKETVENIVDYLHERSGILMADSPNSFRFPVRSFQEYMAAVSLNRDNNYPRAAAKLAKNLNLWKEVLLFAAWRSKWYRDAEVWKLADALCASEFSAALIADDDSWAPAIMAGLIISDTKVYQDTSSDEFTNTLIKVKTWLLECIKRGAIGRQSLIEVGDIIGRLGDDRTGTGTSKDGLPQIEWIKIPNGPFMFGRPAEDDQAMSQEPDMKELNAEAFFASKYPITVKQFRSYVESKDFFRNYSQETQDKWLSKLNRRIDNHPVSDVTFDEAVSFCSWLEKKVGYQIRLPSEEEWEKAARGGIRLTDEMENPMPTRLFPWGQNFDDNVCNIGASGTCAVGLFSKGVSPYGLYDMSGNVWEWCNTVADWKYYRGPTVKPHDFEEHVIRGGSFCVSSISTRCSAKEKDGNIQFPGQGFRVFSSTVS